MFWILHSWRVISKFDSGLDSGACFLCVVLTLFLMLLHNVIWFFCSPWLAASPTSSPVIPPVMFSAIVEEELQQEAALIRSREKPLALIQIEECAIQDLLIHYEAFDNPDEFVTVERAPQRPIAAPMWNKH